MEKNTQALLAGLIVGAMVIGGLMYGVGRPVWEESAYSRGRLAVTPEVVGAAQQTAVTWSTETIDHSATVASDGAVSTETSVTTYLNIENKGDDSITEFTIALTDLSDAEGLPTGLEDEDFQVYVTTSWGSEYPLFKDAEYRDGYIIDEFKSGEKINVTLTFTFTVAAAGTFDDGESYTAYVYLIQPDAKYTQSESLTIST